MGEGLEKTRNKIEKKKVAVTIFMTSIFLGPLPILLRLIDTYYGTSLFPENGTDTLFIGNITQKNIGKKIIYDLFIKYGEIYEIRIQSFYYNNLYILV